MNSLRMICRKKYIPICLRFLNTKSNTEIFDRKKIQTRKTKTVFFNPQDLSYVDDVFKNIDVISVSEWGDIKERFKKTLRCNDNNVSSIIIEYLIKNSHLKIAKDFVEYLNQTKAEVNIGTLGKLLKLYHFFGLNSELTDSERTRIIEIYTYISNKYKIFDQSTTDNCICALCMTNSWKESLNIIEKMKSYLSPSRVSYCNLIIAAFRNDDPDTGWMLLRDTSIHRHRPYDELYSCVVDYYVSKYGNDKKMLLLKLEEIFQYCGENDFDIGLQTAQKLVEIMSTKLNWKTSFIKLKKSGWCNECQSHLQSIDVSSEDFKRLTEAFYDKVLIGKNVFMKSSPKEIDEFLKFLEKTAPYDVVIDALNVLYSKPHCISYDILLSVIRKLKMDNEKILVLGRKHMNKMPKNDMNFLKMNTLMYFTDDLSYDDTFLLYATLRSPDTKFISRDLMRSHRFLLNCPNLRVIFKRWQQKNQISIVYASKNDVILKSSTKILPVAQKSVGWHIPYTTTDSPQPADTFEFPTDWICLHPKRKQIIH